MAVDWTKFAAWCAMADRFGVLEAARAALAIGFWNADFRVRFRDGAWEWRRE